MNPQWQIINADVLAALRAMPDNTVQTAITSPPYWMIRKYDFDGEIGLEPTLDEFIVKMVEVFRELRRVLRPDGTFWMNIDDSRGGSTMGNIVQAGHGIKPKDLMMVPERLAIAMIEDGWYLRSKIIWAKPNGLMEAAHDRPTHTWEPIFLFARSASYYYDYMAVMEPALTQHNGAFRGDSSYKNGNRDNNDVRQRTEGFKTKRRATLLDDGYTPEKNRRDVWYISTEASREGHRATYPRELVRLPILAGTSERGQCPQCGSPMKRIVVASGGTIGKSWSDHVNDDLDGRTLDGDALAKSSDGTYRRETKGWEPTCSCGCDQSAYVPQIVLDPFSGTATTGIVALQNNRSYIGIEGKQEYAESSRRRLINDMPLMNAGREAQIVPTPQSEEPVLLVADEKPAAEVTLQGPFTGTVVSISSLDSSANDQLVLPF